MNPGKSQVDDGFESLNGNGSSDNNEEEVNKSGEEGKGEESVLREVVLSPPFVCSSSHPGTHTPFLFILNLNYLLPSEHVLYCSFLKTLLPIIHW